MNENFKSQFFYNFSMKRILFYTVALIGIILIMVGGWNTVTKNVFYVLHLIVGIVLVFLADKFLLPKKNR